MGVAQQLLYPGARISTLKEVFDFVSCADPAHHILWNIESKIDAHFPNRTAGVQDFVQRQHAIFQSSPYYRSITVSSLCVPFDYLLKSCSVPEFRLEDAHCNEGKRDGYFQAFGPDLIYRNSTLEYLRLL